MDVVSHMCKVNLDNVELEPVDYNGHLHMWMSTCQLELETVEINRSPILIRLKNEPIPKFSSTM